MEKCNFNKLKKINLESIKKCVKKIIDKIYDVYALFIATNMPLYSSNATLFLIISSIPMFMLVFSTISFIPNVKIDDMIYQINLIFPNLPYVRKVIGYVTNIASSLATKSVISLNILFAIVSVSTALYSFTIGIRKVHNITHRSNYLIQRIFAFLNMFVFLIAIVLMLIAFIMGGMILKYVTTYVPLAENTIEKILSYKYLPALFLIFVLMMSLYSTATNFERKIRHNIIGAIIATILWLIISNLYSFYFLMFPLNESIYGSLVGIVVILLWAYTINNIIFLGAVINEIFFPEKQILEERKNMIMRELEKGNDEKVDRIIQKMYNSSRIKKYTRSNSTKKSADKKAPNVHKQD